jgi:hypothetical protein
MITVIDRDAVPPMMAAGAQLAIAALPRRSIASARSSPIAGTVSETSAPGPRGGSSHSGSVASTATRPGKRTGSPLTCPPRARTPTSQPQETWPGVTRRPAP